MQKIKFFEQGICYKYPHIFLYFQANSGEDGNVLNEVSNPFSSPGSSDGSDIIPDNSDRNTATVTTKHVKQNSFDSGIADAAHSFSSTRGNNLATNVILD